MSGEANYRQWECQMCGDIYDEALGAPDFGIDPGTRFEDLPDDWMCPACGASKDDYVLIEN